MLGSLIMNISYASLIIKKRRLPQPELSPAQN